MQNGRKVKETKTERAWHENSYAWRRAMNPDTMFESIPRPFKGILVAQARVLGKMGSIFSDPQEAKKALGIDGFSQY